MPIRPCGICGIPAPEGQCSAHPRIRAPRQDRAKWQGPWPALATAVLRRDGYRCRYCGAPARSADHVVPDLPIGYLLTVPALAVAACRSCNSSKRDWDLEHWVASTRAPAGARLVLNELWPLIHDAERWLQHQRVFPNTPPAR